MGYIYAWATPEYLLDVMTLEQVFMYYDYGLELFTGNPSKEETTPDKDSFYKNYGDKIKRPKETKWTEL